MQVAGQGTKESSLKKDRLYWHQNCPIPFILPFQACNAYVMLDTKQPSSDYEENKSYMLRMVEWKAQGGLGP